MSIHYIDEATDLSGKTVLVRAGLSAPVENGRVVNDFRIKRTLPTLTYLKDQGAKTIIIGHINRDPKETLQPVADELNKHIQLQFLPLEGFNSGTLQNGETVMLENLRQDPRERKNDEEFAKELASLADVFVQDAFSVCHRAHASIVGVPKLLPSYGGLLLKEEIEGLSTALSPESPSLAVLGGAKFETKEPLILKLLDVYDNVFVGGALANEVLAAQGHPVGRSVVEDRTVAKDILDHDRLLPVSDVVVENEDKEAHVVRIGDVTDDETIVDIGPDTMRLVAEKAQNARTVVWNGPLGWYERGYTKASDTLADAIAAGSGQEDGVCRAHAIIGGGDTIAILDEHIHDACTFISTGGGAMITFLEKGTLPGIDALK